MHSKLPDVETTIFTVMSRRAAQTGALNIGQGFPDYPIDPDLAACATRAMQEGRNQYAPMEGVLDLREGIAAKLRATQDVAVDPVNEITLTCGGTEALFSAIQAFVSSGDNVVVFEPAYDAYEPAVRLAGGQCRRIPLLPPDFRIDWRRVAGTMDDRTRLVILNNPHNPACTIATRDDLAQLAELLRARDCRVLADEVYEHVVFDGQQHVSVLAHPELRERSLAVFSFGKTLHVTGWRVGYCVAGAALTREFRKVHQFNTFSIVAPLQHGIAAYLRQKPSSWQELSGFFQRKRDLLRTALQGTGFDLPAAQGTYFQLLDYSALSRQNDVEFADRLMQEARLAAIPLSPFYRDRPHLTLLRLCIAKQDATLLDAAERLQKFAAVA